MYLRFGRDMMLNEHPLPVSVLHHFSMPYVVLSHVLT